MQTLYYRGLKLEQDTEGVYVYSLRADGWKLVGDEPTLTQAKELVDSMIGWEENNE